MSWFRTQGAGKTAKLIAALRGLSPLVSNITVEGGGVAVEIWAVLDPLSKTAQRVAPVLQFLADTLQPSIKASLVFCQACQPVEDRQLLDHVHGRDSERPLI